MVDYLELLKRSWKGFRENLVLFLPYLIGICFGIVMIALLAAEIFIMLYYTDTTINDWLSMHFFDLIQTTEFLIVAIISLIIDAIAIIIIRAYLSSIYIGMMKDIAEKGKTEARNIFAYGRKYFLTVINIILYKLLLYLLPLAVLVLLTIFLYAASKPAGVVFGILAFLAYVAYAVVITAGLFFIYPVVAWQKGGAWALIRESFKATKENLGHALLTIIISIAITLIYTVIFYMIELPLKSLVGYTIGATIGLIVIVIVVYGVYYLIRIITGLIMGYVLEIFRYNAFLECGSVEAPSGKETKKARKK